MELSGGDVIAKVLKDYRISNIFTLSGGHISPILVGCKRAGINVVDVRNEANAVFAADATARITGIPGVAVVTAGPGVTNTITALKNAQMAQSPLVLFGGSAATVIKGRGSLQDIDQISLLKSTVKFAVTVNRNCDIIPAIEHAFEAAKSGVPGPVFVECPIDILYDETMVRLWYEASGNGPPSKSLKSRIFQFYIHRHLDKIFECDLDTMEPEPPNITIPEPDTAKTNKAVRLLSAAEKPVLLVGSQAMLCSDSVDDLSKAVTSLGMPIYLAGMARGLLGATSSLQIRHHRKNALKNADLVMIAGMPCDFRLNYGRAINSKATLISINRSKTDLTMNRKPELGILADPCQFLCNLAKHQFNKPADWKRWIESLRTSDKEREEEINDMAAENTDLINPLTFLKTLDSFLDDDSILVADGGDFVATSSYTLRPRGPLSWLDPGVFGTLGVGAGFALGAKLCRPESEVWIIYGDGSAGYSLQEFDTFVRHRIPVIAVVGNDASWAQIARDQVEVLGDDVATVLRRSDYHTVAEGFGGKGFLLKDAEQIRPVLEKAKQVAGKGIPVLINVHLGKTDFRKGSISM
ncbi:MAG: thiamine pyrophosphate-binding protein [Deltaproteobacteria bacterium]|nr:thiamine pyrophosphate-binding protein [Deltaproteobacteria bacterium]